MKTLNYTVYEYNELDKKAQEKAREWWNSLDNDYPFLEEAMKEYATNLLEETFTGVEVNAVYYSLSYSQGDGAMAEFTGTYKKKYRVTCKQSGHYNHYNSTSYTITDEDGNDADEVIEEQVREECVSVFKALEEYGYAYIEAEREDENVAENIRANEYTFLIDGTRFG